jgi:hypothetical protein
MLVGTPTPDSVTGSQFLNTEDFEGEADSTIFAYKNKKSRNKNNNNHIRSRIGLSEKTPKGQTGYIMIKNCTQPDESQPDESNSPRRIKPPKLSKVPNRLAPIQSGTKPTNPPTGTDPSTSQGIAQTPPPPTTQHLPTSRYLTSDPYTDQSWLDQKRVIKLAEDYISKVRTNQHTQYFNE